MGPRIWVRLKGMPLLYLFDMDDVLYDYDWRARMAGLTELTGLDLGELRRRWWHDEGEWAAEAGRYPDADSYHSAFVTALGVPVSVDEWVQNRRSAMTAWPESIAAVERAAQLGQVSLLTNNGPLLEAHLATIAPEIAALFGDHLRTTSYYGARKPDPAVFDRVLAAYDADPADVFFADDLPQNVAAAESRGITGHVFTTPAALLAAVEAFAS
jgi:FMN phosphatase YigB (HAD superfamily)